MPLAGSPRSGQQEVNIMKIKTPGWTVIVHVSISIYSIEFDVSVQHS